MIGDFFEPIRGRGASSNPPNRFERIDYVADDDCERQENRPRTEFFRDPARTIIAYNDSPDVGFSTSINPYRGCEHGCIYCFARPTHEYLGLSSGLDFETKIFVKEDAPELLKKELSARSWKPQTVAISGVTDPYQPAERKFEITRRCLEVLAEFRNPVTIVTKNQLVARDADVLADLAQLNAAAVCISVTSLDREVANVMEPRASEPHHRLKAIEALARAGVPVGILVAPVVPAITDHEMPKIIAACASAGASFGSYVVLRLPFAVKELFVQWLEQHFPDRKEKVLSRIKDLRGGDLYDSRWGIRQSGQGVFADQIESLFDIAARRAGFGRFPELTAEHFRVPRDQMALF